MRITFNEIMVCIFPAERAVGIKIMVADEFDESNFENNDFFLCAEQMRQLPSGSVQSYYCKTWTTGRFAIITKDRIRDGSFLEFCELEVWAHIKEGETIGGGRRYLCFRQ